MNERIKQLVEQAFVEQPPVQGTARLTKDIFGSNQKKFSPEKFAELIVKECAQTAARFSIDKNDIHPDIKWDEMSEAAKAVSHTTCQHVSAKIIDHFGMK